jgi:phage shock protein A
MVSMHDKVDKMLERQQTCVEQLTKQMAVMQDLANKVARMDKEMAKLTKKVKKITMDQ